MRKVFGITKRLNRGGRRAAIALLLCLSVFNLFSCVNDVDLIEDLCAPEASSSAERMIFSGLVNVDGAVPKAVTNVVQSENIGRAAIPSFMISDSVQYSIIAKCTSTSGITDIEGSVDADTKTYTIGLTIGRTYNIKAELKRIDPATNEETTLLEDEWQDVKPSRESTSFNHNFILKPKSSGTGTVSLDIKVPSADIDAEFSGDDWDNTLSSKITKTGTGTVNLNFSGSGIPVGSYLVSINFYKTAPLGSTSIKILQYSIPQTLNVFANMTTDTWQDSGSSGSPISGGKFELKPETINAYQRTIYYVGKAANPGSDETGTGSAYAPFATFGKAIEAIQLAGDPQNYKIFIGGTLTGNQTIPAELTTSLAKSITIEGLAGLSSGDQQDAFDAGGSGRVLEIKTAVPITIKNLKITGGRANHGAGIYIGTGSTTTSHLILDSGSLVTENRGEGGSIIGTGTGVYIDSYAILTMKKGSAITNNKPLDDATNTSGGGIAVSPYGQFLMEGGLIQGNSASNGGGIFQQGDITIKDGLITKNTAKNIGGGIYYLMYSNMVAGVVKKTLTITGGTISENSAASGGAISYAILFISGSVYIPYGVDGIKQTGKNDILIGDPKVTVNGTLSKHSSSDNIAVTCSTWNRNKAIVEAGTGVSDITPYNDLFNLTDDNWEKKISSDGTQILIDSPIYVSGATSHPFTKVAGSASGDGTKSKPFDSIQKALTVMDSSTTDYTILIDGELVGSQLIGDAVANSITIKGVNVLESGEPKDIINGNNKDTALKLQTAVPVTVSSLKITGGSSSYGGGISLTSVAKLTLADDVLVTENKASNVGGGIYLSNTDPTTTATLKVKGNVKIYGNTKSGSTSSSNVHLQPGEVIQIIGALTKGTDKANIWVDTETAPVSGTPISITSGYGYTTGGYNAGVAPSTYFKGYFDGKEYAVFATAASGEALMGYNAGGNITVEPVYDTDFKISIDKKSYAKTAAEKKFTFSPADGVLYSYEVIYHGRTVPAEYYTTSENTLTFLDTMPAGDYTINVTAVYNGTTYSGGFDVKIKATNSSSIGADEAVMAISELTETSSIAVTGEITESQLQLIGNSIKAITASDVNVKLDLSKTTGLTEIKDGSFDNCTHLEEILLPEGITKIDSDAFYLCTNLKNITIPSTVTEISGSAFYRVPADITLTADNSDFKTVGDAIYTSDGKELVLYCKKQEENSTFTVPASVTKIREFAFCSAKIQKVIIESGSQLTEIEACAFDCCQSLRSINIPDAVSVIGYDAFYADGSFEEFNLPSELLILEGGVVPANLTTVVIPDKVTEIKYAAFWGTAVETVILPKSLVKLESDAFGEARNLKDVKYKGSDSDKLNILGLDDNAYLRDATWQYNYTGD